MIQRAKDLKGDFPGGPEVENLLSSAGYADLIPGWRRSREP